MQQPTDPSLAEDTVMHEGAVSVRLGLRGCPSTAEQIALERDLALVRKTGARYHASALSTKEAVAAIARAKGEGLSVTADVAVANLVWTDDDVAHYESSYRVVPPLRDRTHQDALLDGLATGVIDAVSSNHSPRSTLEKSGEFDLSASGITSLETTLSSLWALHEAGRMSLPTLVRSLVSGPSRVLQRESPRLVEGAAASFALIDPNRSWTPSAESLMSKSWNTPFLGQSLRGKVLMTLHRGAILYQDARLQLEPSRDA
jgi:dihydroorotase